MKYTELLSELKELEGSTLISFHSLGDVEAVASALSLAKLLKQSEVKSPDKTNSASRHLLQGLGLPAIPIVKQKELNNYNNLVLVDVANKDMLGKFGEEVARFKGKIIAIDHHEHGKMLANARMFEFVHRTSCCEVIYDLYRVSRKKMDSITATLLLTGVIADTARFKTANRQTFSAVSQLLIASGKEYGEVLSLARAMPDNSEIKNVFQALLKLKLIETEGGLIGVVENNAFESKTCLALVETGCVVGICLNPKNGKIAMAKDTENPHSVKVDVGKILKQFGPSVKGSGGGHESIGGLTGKPELVKKAVQKMVIEIKNILK